MSWLARSIADSLRIDDLVDSVDPFVNEPERLEKHDHADAEVGVQSEPDLESREVQLDEFDEEEEVDDASRGVKEDLTELKQTLTRQFWGVASFLAPPPPPPPLPPRFDRKEDFLDGEVGCDDGKDGDEDGMRLDKSASLRNASDSEEEEEEKTSANLDIVRDAAECVDLGAEQAAAEEEDEVEVWDVVGITEEVLTFGRNIAMHPETWLDYPVEEEDDPDAFVMTTDQQEHTYAMEYLSPRLAALRIELCPAHMSEGYFWKVYFVLLHSRLEKQDAEILSTPQVIAARSLWMRELQKQTRERASLAKDTSYFNDHFHSLDDHHVRTTYSDAYSSSTSYRTYDHSNAEPVVEKHPIPGTETHTVDKIVIIEDKPMIEITDKKSQPSPSLSSKQLIEDEEDDDDDWLKDENINTSIPIWEEEEVSFSDFEDDEDLLPLKSQQI